MILVYRSTSPLPLSQFGQTIKVLKMHYRISIKILMTTKKIGFIKTLIFSNLIGPYPGRDLILYSNFFFLVVVSSLYVILINSSFAVCLVYKCRTIPCYYQLDTEEGSLSSESFVPLIVRLLRVSVSLVDKLFNFLR